MFYHVIAPLNRERRANNIKQTLLENAIKILHDLQQFATRKPS